MVPGMDYNLSCKKISLLYTNLGFRFSFYNLQKTIFGQDAVFNDRNFSYDKSY